MKKKKLARTGTFTNSNGDVFAILGVPPMLFDEMRIAQEREWGEAERELPAIPVYTTEANEVIDWNEKSVLADGTEEEIQAWQDYENTWYEFQAEYRVKQMRVAFMHIQDDPLEDQDWLDVMDVAGIPVPEKTKELKQLYGETKVLAMVGLLDDLTWLLIELRALSGLISQEEVKAFRASFRTYVEQDTAIRTNGDGERSGEMESIAPVSSTGSSALLGEAAE